MLIIGAKGLAKEVLEIFHQQQELEDLFFYDDLSERQKEKLYNKFTVLHVLEEAIALFKEDNRFTIGVGNPLLRKKLYERFTASGGEFVSAIHPSVNPGNYGTTIGKGAIIMAGAVISNDVVIGIGALINPNCTISHDSKLGDFAELSPGAQITGGCIVGDRCAIGTNAVLLPGIILGDDVIVGAGAVVTKNVASGTTVAGVPAKPINRK